MAEEFDYGSTIRGFSAGQKVFDRYTLKQLLGRGGMGVVWLAHDDDLERDVALKFLPETVASDAQSVKDLKRETRRSLELTHPHIVRIYDFMQNETMAAISMEYVVGATLASLKVDQTEGHFEVAQIQKWTNQLCAALAYAHTRVEVVHRDLKPANLMIDQRGDLKIADFGIAASVSDSVSRVSAASGSSGTPVYMSPQQMMGEKPAVTDDIYALGATLYELLTGKPPFHSGNVMLQVMHKVPPPMEKRRREFQVGGEPIPETWEETIAACLAKEGLDRPVSAVDVASRLRGSGPVSAPPPAQVTSAEPVPPAIPVAVPATTPVQTQPAPPDPEPAPIPVAVPVPPPVPPPVTPPPAPQPESSPEPEPVPESRVTPPAPAPEPSPEPEPEPVAKPPEPKTVQETDAPAPPVAEQPEPDAPAAPEPDPVGESDPKDEEKNSADESSEPSDEADSDKKTATIEPKFEEESPKPSRGMRYGEEAPKQKPLPIKPPVIIAAAVLLLLLGGVWWWVSIAKPKQEAAEIAAAEQAKKETELAIEREVESRLKAEREAAAEAARLEEERLARIEAERLEAERLAREEAEQLAAAAAAKAEFDRLEPIRTEKLAALKGELSTFMREGDLSNFSSIAEKLVGQVDGLDEDRQQQFSSQLTAAEELAKGTLERLSAAVAKAQTDWSDLYRLAARYRQSDENEALRDELLKRIEAMAKVMVYTDPESQREFKLVEHGFFGEFAGESANESGLVVALGDPGMTFHIDEEREQKGVALWEEIPAGEYTISWDQPGRQTASRKVTVEPGGLMNLGILEPGPAGETTPKVAEKPPEKKAAAITKKPVPLIRSAPIYPRTMRSQGITGQVMVRFVIDPLGRVTNPEIVSSTNSGFNEAAINCVMKWRFSPGEKDGEPVPVAIRVPIVFNLN